MCFLLCQAADCDLERGHSGASGGHHLSATAGRPAPHGPLCDRVKTGGGAGNITFKNISFR